MFKTYLLMKTVKADHLHKKHGYVLFLFPCLFLLHFPFLFLPLAQDHGKVETSFFHPGSEKQVLGLKNMVPGCSGLKKKVPGLEKRVPGFKEKVQVKRNNPGLKKSYPF